MTTATHIKILSLIDYGIGIVNLGILRETEKAYLIKQNYKSNKNTWFPKSGFKVIREENNRITVEIKTWFYNRLSPEQEAILGECGIVR